MHFIIDVKSQIVEMVYYDDTIYEHNIPTVEYFCI